MIQGALKDNLQFQGSIESIWKYLVMGLILLLGSIGTVILVELSFIQIFSSELNSLLLYLFVGTAILIYIYIKYFRRER
ncbi:MAG: hypothetical protein ACFFDN_17750 [Candidatus Hodarchaeota archaeon]